MNDVHTFPCSGCGSALEFSPEVLALRCDNCGFQHEARHHTGEIAEHDYFAALDQGKGGDVESVRLASACDACGAQFEMTDNTHAGQCPYCDSPMVHDPAEQRSIPVHAVLPFAVTA